MTESVRPDFWDPACVEEVERLELQRARSFGVLESMVDGLVIADADGQIVYWNGRVEELLGPGLPLRVGLSATEFKRLLAARSTDPDRGLDQLSCSAIDLHRLPHLDLEMAGPQPLTLQVLQFPISGPQGEDWGCGLILRDVTEQRQMDKVKANLLAVVSHELRAPLSSIKGFATTLLRTDVDWGESARHEFLTIIDEESDRLADLVEELLDTSRLVLGQFTIEPEELEIKPLLERIVAQAQSKGSPHRFALEIVGEPAPIWADPRRLQQILHNLVDNAIKYSPEGGQITVRCQTQGDKLVISVTDQGRGIPQNEQGLLFEPFYRGRTAEGGQQTGLGLGLSLCRGYVEAHGGQIWVRSAPQQGSTFYFSLPLRPPLATPQPGEATGNATA